MYRTVRGRALKKEKENITLIFLNIRFHRILLTVEAPVAVRVGRARVGVDVAVIRSPRRDHGRVGLGHGHGRGLPQALGNPLQPVRPEEEETQTELDWPDGWQSFNFLNFNIIIKYRGQREPDALRHFFAME